MRRRAIPTKYDGLRFRSRLEATWAAFFDLLGWRYEYEPALFSGWIPDFLIIGKFHTTVVEVKPFTELEEFLPTLEKILAAMSEEDFLKYEILLLGLTPCLDMSQTEAQLGWMNEKHWTTEQLPYCCAWPPESFARALFVWKEERLGFFHAYGKSNRCTIDDRISGVEERRYPVSGLAFPEEIDVFWKKAKNTVQWRGRRT